MGNKICLGIILFIQGTLFSIFMIYKKSNLLIFSTLLSATGLLMLLNKDEETDSKQAVDSLHPTIDYLKCRFERVNEKYNRLWSNLIAIFIFLGTIISAFVISLIGINREVYFQSINLIFVVMYIVITLTGIGFSFIFEEIIKVRISLFKILSKIKNNNQS